MSRSQLRSTLAVGAIVLAWSVASVVSAGPAERRAPSPEAGCASIEPGQQRVVVQWGLPVATRACFFFSGPRGLGRDDHLGSSARLSWRGARLTLSFGRVRFTGSTRAGRVSLRRSSTHEYHGRWQVTETIEGRLQDEHEDGATCTVIRATYRYTECQAGGRCPGVCTISDSLVISAAGG